MPYLQLQDDSRIYYRLIDGQRQRPGLVFLHEGLGCDQMWGGFPMALCEATGCPGLVYDRLGYGKSSALRRQRTVHYMHEYALQELPSVLASVIPDMPYILIGHSDGGSIALIHGAERPPLLRGIITEAAHVFVEPETIAGIKEADEAWEKGKLKGLSKYHGDKTEAIFKAWSETWLSEWFKWWNIEYLLPSIAAPLLVIQGKADQYGSEDQVNTIVTKSAGPAVPKMIPNCGHSPHSEAEAEVLDVMRGFIAGIS